MVGGAKSKQGEFRAYDLKAEAAPSIALDGDDEGAKLLFVTEPLDALGLQAGLLRGSDAGAKCAQAVQPARIQQLTKGALIDVSGELETFSFDTEPCPCGTPELRIINPPVLDPPTGPTIFYQARDAIGLLNTSSAGAGLHNGIEIALETADERDFSISIPHTPFLAAVTGDGTRYVSTTVPSRLYRIQEDGVAVRICAEASFTGIVQLETEPNDPNATDLVFSDISAGSLNTFWRYEPSAGCEVMRAFELTGMPRGFELERRSATVALLFLRRSVVDLENDLEYDYPNSAERVAWRVLPDGRTFVAIANDGVYELLEGGFELVRRFDQDSAFGVAVFEETLVILRNRLVVEMGLRPGLSCTSLEVPFGVGQTIPLPQWGRRFATPVLPVPILQVLPPGD